MEVHAIEARDEGNWQKDRADHSQDLHHFIQSNRADREICFHDRQREFAAAFNLIGDTNEVVLNVAVVHRFVLRDDGELATRQPVDDFALVHNILSDALE